MKVKKIEKMSSIFEFSISKFSRKSEKNFHLFFRTSLTNRSKMKMNMKKFGKMSSIFECSISKSSCTGLFIKIWEKTFFFFRNFYLKRTYLGDRGLERVKIPFLKTPAEGKISNLTCMSKEQKLLDQGKISNLTSMSKE